MPILVRARLAYNNVVAKSVEDAPRKINLGRIASQAYLADGDKLSKVVSKRRQEFSAWAQAVWECDMQMTKRAKQVANKFLLRIWYRVLPICAK